MDAEIQIGLSFFISYLYNKLPRRRVNLFGEELEKAIRQKFVGHWYPERPDKGSAYRCLRVGDPLDPVIRIAARESGLDVQDIVEHIPPELSVWIDPGEVSYRIGEKGIAKLLYTKEKASTPEESPSGDLREHCFNPDAQCFKPIDPLSSSMRNMNMSSEGSSPGSVSPPNAAASPIQQIYVPKSAQSLTFTTAAFAQTKFGSTKLKNTGKRPNRLSPTEFSNYIKQRTMVQQHHPSHTQAGAMFGGNSPHNARSLSPNPPMQQQHQSFDPFMFMAAANQQVAVNQNHITSRSQPQRRSMFDNGYVGGDIFSNNNPTGQSLQATGGAPSPGSQSTAIPRPTFLDVSSSVPSLHNSNNNSPTTANPNINNTLGGVEMGDKTNGLHDSFNFGNVYPNHYQHLLVAN